MPLQLKEPPLLYIWPVAGILLVGVVIWLIIPKPPNTIVMTTGSEKGLYYRFGQQLAQELAKEHITLKVLPSAGSAENLKRLDDRSQGIDLALLQGGVGTPAQHPNLQGLAAVFDEHVWIFYRRAAFKDPLTQITQLKDKRVSLSLPGSGTRVLGLQILGLNGLVADDQRRDLAVVDLDARDSLNALRNKELDAALLVAGPQTAILVDYLKSPDLGIMGFVQADAYALRLPFLKSVTVPRGVISLAEDLPKTDLKLLAAPAALVIHEDIHPALITPLLRASEDAIEKMGLLQKEGDFPSASGFAWPHDDDAKHYLKNGPSFLYRHLPFWSAVWLDRALRIILPLLLVLLPVLKYLPMLLKASVDARLASIYKRLRTLEAQNADGTSKDWRAELDAIDRQAQNLRVPKKFVASVYDLRMHIEIVRERFSQVNS